MIKYKQCISVQNASRAIGRKQNSHIPPKLRNMQPEVTPPPPQAPHKASHSSLVLAVKWGAGKQRMGENADRPYAITRILYVDICGASGLRTYFTQHLNKIFVQFELFCRTGGRRANRRKKKLKSFNLILQLKERETSKQFLYGRYEEINKKIICV